MAAREQFERGAYDALEKAPAYYGCHFGMRNTLERDKAAYHAGHEAGMEWLEGKGEFAKMSFDDMVCKTPVK
jgi:hypothetical protein